MLQRFTMAIAILLGIALVGEIALPSPKAFADDFDDAQPKPKRKKKKKKRKKKNADDQGAPGDNAVPTPAPEGGGLHAKQENAPDKPYAWELALLSDFSTTTTKTEDAKGGSGNYDLSVRALKIMGASFELGGGLNYNEASVKADGKTTTSRNTILSVLAAYNFGDLNTDSHVFFVDAGFGIGQGSMAGVDGSSVKTSLTRLSLGGGMHYFVDNDVALTGQIRYESGSDKPSSGPATQTTTLHLATIGFTLFL